MARLAGGELVPPGAGIHVDAFHMREDLPPVSSNAEHSKETRLSRTLVFIIDNFKTRLWFLSTLQTQVKGDPSEGFETVCS